MTETLKHTVERGIKLDPPSKFFTKLVNKNAIIKPEKGVPSTPQKIWQKGLLDSLPGFSNRVHLWKQ